MQELKKKANDRMEGTINVLRKELASIRTGRASLSLLDGITVEYYGSNVPLSQVATLGIPDGKQIIIQPWEQKLLTVIEKAILKSDLGLTPMNDGKIIRIVVPPLTEERRKQLVKVIKKKAEEARIAIRNIRRDLNEEIKKSEKEKNISEDDAKRLQSEIQKITDSFISKIDEMIKNKEKEIMAV